jgi:hypothetical protein
MKRVFLAIPDDKIEEIDQMSSLVGLGGSGGPDWADLLKSDRVLIISEAGAGKTFECRSQQETMWAAGDAAFFLELAELAKTNVRDMFSPEEEARFDAWRSAQSETATFFLDSYDELKLTLGSFELALKRLAKAIAGQLNRAKVIITSRPITIDQRLFRQILPIPDAAEDQATGEVFADIVMDGRKQKGKEDGPPPWRNVALVPLTDEQIRDMAQSQGVTDANVLIADIKKRNAGEFARRPQDLIELCVDWRDHRRIRTHREQVGNNIKVKLVARTDRKEVAPLSLEKAIDGASRLALAALLTRKLTLRHSAAADHSDNAEAALDPASILSDWTTDERTTLLERPLFGFASYGRVRFHHRSVIEYLAAERMKTLIARGMSRRAAKRLLFATTAQGDHVVKPSVRPVAAWMALADDGIFEEIRHRDPSTLLNFGDPESLRLVQRVEALRAFVERYGAGGWRGLQVPSIQIHRFASADLASEIQMLWNRGIENPEVREILLSIIEAGNVIECADIAYGVVTAPDASYDERAAALSALATLRDGRLDAIIDSMVADANVWPDPITRWAVIRLFPEQIDVERLCRLLGRMAEKPRSAADLSWQLPKLLEDVTLTNEALDELRSRLTALVSEGLTWTNDWPNIVAKRQSLVPVLAATCLRQLHHHTVTADVVRSSVIALRLTHQDYGAEKPCEDLRHAIDSLASPDRQAAFEADDALMQGLRPQSDSLKRFYETGFHGPFHLAPDRDTTWTTAMLADRALAADKRAVMLEAAMCLWDGTGDLKAYLAGLKPLVSDLPHLVDVLDARSQPAKPDPEMKKLEAKLAKHKKETHERNEKARASWVTFWSEIADHPETAFSDDRAANTAWNLWRAMERSGADSRAAGWNRRFIERNFGKATADRLRTTLMTTWRKDRPTLRSERKETEKNTYLVRWQLGLAAITAEAEDASWAEKLTPDEAQLAVRYAPIQLNGFPIWLESLAHHHPSSVDAVLGNELALELDEAIVPGWHSMTLQNIGYAPAAVASLFLPRLEQWLDANLERSGQNEDKSAAANRFAQVIRILLKHGDEGTRERLRTIAANQLATGAKGPIGHVWLPVLMRLDTVAGVEVLEKTLAELPIEMRGEAVQWFGSLLGDGHREFQIDLNESRFTPEQLLRLTRLAYQHVRPADDVEHDGGYSPEARDHAERGRGAVLNALLNSKGTEGWNAKLAMVDDPLFAHFRDRVIAVARERSAEESDSVPVNEADLIALDRNGELPPATRDDMFALLVDRLDDLDDVLLLDDSPRAAWALVKDETIMRQQIARELRNAAKSAYTVDQEAVTADNKETDIRLRSVGSDQQAIIELKIGEKPRSAADLRTTLKEQLVKKYMAPNNSRSGCLLITVAGQRRWEHPDTGKELDLTGLIAMLNEEAKRIQEELGGALRLIAKGLDLTPRLPTERQTSKVAKRSARE